MSIKNRVIAFLYRLGASCISIGALIYDFGFFNGEIKIVNFLYFTIISNMFCCGLFITLTILYQELKNIENAKKYDKKRDFMMRIACRNCYLYKTKYRCNVSNYSCRI